MAVAARVVLGIMFVVAAVSKLSIRGWGRDTSRALRLPFALVQTTPLMELVVGAGLITGLRLMPQAAIGLLLIYTGVLFVQISREDAAPCACFGRAAKPITWRTIARNGLLLALAVVSVGA